MTGRRNLLFLGTLALAAALLTTTSLTTYAAEATPPAPASGGGAPSASDLDAILKQTQGPADAAPAPSGAGGAPAAADSGGAPPAGDAAGAPAAAAGAAPDAGGPPPAADAGGAPPAADAGGAPPPAGAGGTPLAPNVSAGPSIPPDIHVPTDPIAKAAFDALDAHCARCHQDGMLVHRKSAEKNFGFVLQFDKLKSDPNFVVPGNPDASKLVQKILNKEMPYDYYHDYPTDATPVSDAEFAAIRNWISNLGAAQAAACPQFISPEQMVQEMAADLSSLDKTRVADTRYFTLTHLYNACSTPEEMDIYRKAVVKLLNSLSTVSDVVRLETIDKEQTIIRFNLKDVGWTPEDWEKILAVYPYGARPDVPAFDLLTSQTLTPLPYVRGDFFAFAAPRAPLYYQLLDLPDTFQALQQKIGVDVLKDISSFNVKRAGFQNSGVSRNNRMIERHTIPTGYLWVSYDFSGDKDKQNFFEFPLGPGDGPHAFKHAGGEMIFSLPNGFQAYYLATADGKRLDVGPNVIVQDPKQRDYSVHEGISCMSCHELGIRTDNHDEVRDHVLADRTFDKGVRDAVTALFAPKDELNNLYHGDKSKFLNSLAAAGLAATDSNGKPIYDQDGYPKMPNLNGTDEMIYSLSKRYEDSVSLPLAAAEFGESPEQFTQSLAGSGQDIAIRLGRRLDQGTKVVPRDVIESEFKDLVTHVSDLVPIDLSSLSKTVVASAPTIPSTKPPAVAGETFDLSLVSDRSSYAVNDLPVFTITTAQDCFLTILDVDGHGTATVLYPNKYQQENHLKAGQDFKFPGDDAPYQFRFADPGTETVTASCTLQDHPVDGIKLDKARDFTELGNYEQHLSRAIHVDPKVAGGGAKPAAPTDTIARTAIKLLVK